MPVLPHIEDLKEEPYNLTQAQLHVQESFVWLLILVNSALLVIILINSWSILIKLRKWRTAPLTLFYAMGFVAVVLRLIGSVWFTAKTDWQVICGLLQPVAMSCVGLIQAWMIFELSMRFRDVNIKYLNIAKTIFLANIVLLFVGSAIILSILIDESPDKQKIEANTGELFALIYLTLFLILLVVNIDLIRQLSKKES